jgi:hypothetical protein
MTLVLHKDTSGVNKRTFEFFELQGFGFCGGGLAKAVSKEGLTAA